MRATGTEEYNKLTAELLVYLRQQVGQDVNGSIHADAQNYYGGADYTRDLCEILRSLSESDVDKIVYNARNAMARKLADWWEEHQEADRKREAKEAEEAKKEAIRKEALATLSDEAKDALGLWE
jgi:hypothetical protein